MRNGVSVEEGRGRAWAMGVMAWAIPGAGHVLQKCVWRGLILGGTVWALLATGFLLGGHLNMLGDFGAETLLAQVFGVFNTGIGLPYVWCWLSGTGFTQYAERPTYEYGNTLLMVAGLLNYLVMLDAFDIGVRRRV